VSAPAESLTGIALVLAGWPVYRLWVRRLGDAAPLAAGAD